MIDDEKVVAADSRFWSLLMISSTPILLLFLLYPFVMVALWSLLLFNTILSFSLTFFFSSDVLLFLEIVAAAIVVVEYVVKAEAFRVVVGVIRLTVVATFPFWD